MPLKLKITIHFNNCFYIIFYPDSAFPGQLCEASRNHQKLLLSYPRSLESQAIKQLSNNHESYIMVEDFAAIIDGWHDFYMLAGSAAATLLGLLFVAVSLHIDKIAKTRNSSDVVEFARRTLSNFLVILAVAFIFVIPGQSPYGTGIPLLLLGLVEMWRTAKLWKRFEFGSKEERVLGTVQFRSSLLIPNTVCYLAQIFISVELLYGNTNYLGWMTMVIIWLLIDASESAWILMLRLAEITQEKLN